MGTLAQRTQRSYAPIPASIVDNKPSTVSVTLPQAWMTHSFESWMSEHADEFIDYMLANNGVYLKLKRTLDDDIIFEIDA